MAECYVINTLEKFEESLQQRKVSLLNVLV